MIRGTTPTITITGIDATDWDSVWLTFEHAGGQLTKTGEALETTSDGVAVKLSQADTLSFPEGCVVKVQLRAERDAGDTAIACEVMRFTAGEVLLEEVIPLAQEGGE